MKRKNVARLLTVMIAIFVCVPIAFGEGPTQTKITCEEACGKACLTGIVPCPETMDGPQGEPSSITALSPFDFEGKPVGGSFGATGYRSGYNYQENNGIDCKFIFDVCACNEACEVKPGSRMGIQIVIKTDGVYFADPTMTTVYFDIAENASNFCNEPIVKSMTEGWYYQNPDGERVGYRPTDSQLGQPNALAEKRIRNFGTVKYYRTYSEDVNSKGYFITKLSDEGVPLGGSYTGGIPADNKVYALQSETTTDYMFTDTDTEGHCSLWIDIPAMRIDPEIAKQGEDIEVMVRLLFNRDFEGICEDCNPPDVCECTRIVGRICPVGPVDVDEYCMLFPYVLQNLNPWWSGIVVMARDDELAADATFTITAKDAAGNMGTYKVTNVTPIWTSVIDSIIPQFTMTKGTMFEAGALSLKVESNYSIHGYSFLTDNNFGAGTLATGCTPGRCSP